MILLVEIDTKYAYYLAYRGRPSSLFASRAKEGVDNPKPELLKNLCARAVNRELWPLHLLHY